MSTTTFGAARVLRPYKRFEADYDGLSGDVPIMFSWPPNPNEVPIGGQDIYRYDELARQGVSGYSQYLAAGVSVPIAASLLFYIPQVPIMSVTPSVYVWNIAYRLRNLEDFARNQKPYSVGKRGLGTGNNYVIPACRSISTYVRREPSVGLNEWKTQANQYAWAEGIAIKGRSGFKISSGLIIFNPSVLSQGVLPHIEIAETVYELPMFPIWDKAAGNEVILMCQKYKYTSDNEADWTPVNWNFIYDPVTGKTDPAAEDLWFSSYFGEGTVGETPLPDCGVYLMGGEPSV